MYTLDLFLYLPFPVAVLAADNVTILYNQKWQSLFDLTSQDKILINSSQLIPFQNYIAQFLEAKDICIKTQEAFTFNMYLSHVEKDNDYHVTVFVVEKNELQFTVGFWSKLANYEEKTNRAENQLSLTKNNSDKLRLILDNLLKNLPVYVYWKNIEGVFEGCNDLLANLAGYRNASDLIGRTDYEVTSKEEADKIRAHDKVVMSELKSLVVEEAGYYPSTNKEMNALSYKAPLLDKDNKVVGVIGISVDITEKKQLEKALNMKNKELENVLVKYKDFVLNQEHDIRTPVANVEGLAAALIEQLTDPAALELAKLIYQSAKAQHAYQNTMLDSIYLFNEKTENYRRRFQIRNIIEQVIAIFACSFHEEKLNFSLELSQSLPKFLLGDWFIMQQILVCLLSNAVKFTNPNGKIWLRCVPEFKSERQIVLVFDVEDTGIGIPNDQLNTIFEPFVRLTLSNIGKYEGRGLGLTFVKKMVDDLGGEIDVTSVLGKGSLFRLLLPYKISLSSEQLPSLCSSC